MEAHTCTDEHYTPVERVYTQTTDRWSMVTAGQREKASVKGVKGIIEGKDTVRRKRRTIEDYRSAITAHGDTIWTEMMFPGGDGHENNTSRLS